MYISRHPHRNEDNLSSPLHSCNKYPASYEGQTTDLYTSTFLNTNQTSDLAPCPVDPRSLQPTSQLQLTTPGREYTPWDSPVQQFSHRPRLLPNTTSQNTQPYRQENHHSTEQTVPPLQQAVGPLLPKIAKSFKPRHSGIAMFPLLDDDRATFVCIFFLIFS